MTRLGYKVNNDAYNIIQQADDWYRARETESHKRVTVNGQRYTLERMGFGARAAGDDANLCEVIEINAGDGGQYDFINDLLKANWFDTQFRKQLEMTSAEGTAACYVRLENADAMDDGSVQGGQIRLNYVDAKGFIPLTVVNDEVTEAGFWGEDVVKGKTRTTVVLCLLDEAKRYTYTVRVFDDNGRELDEYAQDVALGDVKPFAVMRTAQVNTLDNMQGFGLPKLYGVIPVLRGLDAAFTALMRDIDTAEKIVLINEVICGFGEDEKPIPPNEAAKKLFVFLGEKLPDQKDIIQEINPEIRIGAFRETIELLLGLLSQKFGFGSKKYGLDDNSEITTATEYIGERQDMMQELNRQRQQAREYIQGIVRACLWFANTYQGGGWDIDANVLVEFDDSYITNEAEELNEMRNDIALGIGGPYVVQQYLMRRYNLDEAEALKWATAGVEGDPTEEEGA